MSEIDPITGLPKELSIGDMIAKQDQWIKIKVDKRKFGKLITVISGFDTKNINVRDIAKKLKSKLACGGTSKNNTVELQGDHRKKAKDELIKLGFDAGTIDMQ